MLKSFIFFLLWIFQVKAFQFHVCTVASHQNQQLEQLLFSAVKQGVFVEVLGLNLPYRGNGQKLVYLKEYLQNIPKEDVVLFVDGYDVLFVGNQEAILQKFFAFKKPILFSAERGCFPYKLLAQKYPRTDSSFKYLNSGTFIGYAGALRQLLENISPINPKMSDQGQLTHYFLKHIDEIALDYNCELFVCMHDVARSEFSFDPISKKMVLVATGTYPEIIHCNGNGKEVYQELSDAITSVP